MNRRPIAGIYLAAGQSRRMGTDKLVLPVCGVPLGAIALRAAVQSELDSVTVVTNGRYLEDWIEYASPEQSGRCKLNVVVCEEADRGMAYSLRAGIRSAIESKAEAAVIMLADQPFVASGLINALIETYNSSREKRKPIHYAASSYEGVRRPPVLFAADVFPMLMKLEGDEGARRLLAEGGPLSGESIASSDPALFQDIDTLTQYEFLLAKHDAMPLFHG